MNYTLRLVNGRNKQRGIKPLYIKHPFVTKKKVFWNLFVTKFPHGHRCLRWQRMLFWEILCPKRKEKRFVNIRRELLLLSELLTNTLKIIISKVFECEKNKLPSEGGDVVVI